METILKIKEQQEEKNIPGIIILDNAFDRTHGSIGRMSEGFSSRPFSLIFL